MNGKWIPVILSVALVVGLPRLVFGIWSIYSPTKEWTESSAESTDSGEITKIRVLMGNVTTEMDLQEYLVGVLLKEIPGEFHMEAQRAQAVVARTYTLRTIQFKDKHLENAICVDPQCCQGYEDISEYLHNGGSEDRINLAREAVDQTKGEVLTYEGTLIDATYFSCSGGQTEDALAVWGIDIPYLQSVSSPGEEHATYYWDSVQFTFDEFQDALSLELDGSPGSWFGSTTYTKGGGVETIRIGDRVYSGTELRTKLGLRSTAFSISVSNGKITIITKGFGHRVGMSQYGANAMALNGAQYSQILTHYYPGTEIDKVDFIG